MGLTGADSRSYKAIIRAKRQITDTPDVGDPTSGEREETVVSGRVVDGFGETSTKSLRQEQKRLSPEEIESVVAEYESGKTTYELAEQFGCHRQTISDILKKRGVKVNKGSALRKLDGDKVIAMYAEMHTSAEIAEQFDVRPQAIIRCLKANGVKIRTRWDYVKK